MTKKQSEIFSKMSDLDVTYSWMARMIGMSNERLHYQINKASEIRDSIYIKAKNILDNFDNLKHISFPKDEYIENEPVDNLISEVNENYNIVEEYVNPKFEQLQKDVNTLTQLYKDMLFEMKQIEKQRQNADEEFKQVIENLVEENRILRVQFAAMAEKYNFKLNSHG